MHIGLDARLTYYRAGGISTYIKNLIRVYEQLNTGHQYTVFHSRKATHTLSDVFPRANLWTPCHHRIERTALSVELAPYCLDVLHSPDFIPPRRGAKHHVISVHDLSFLHYPEFMTAESRRYYVSQIQAAVRNADHILTISKSSRADIVKMLGAPPSKVTVHMLGVGDEFSPQTPQAIATMRAELALPEAYILFLGTFEPRKNIAGLLTAYGKLRTTLPSAPPLVIAGSRGWLFEETMTKIKRLSLDDTVYLRERVPQTLLPALYSAAVAHVMPSFYEGFGLPALEAMACGTLPIVSNVSSLPEVVGDVGLQVDPHDPDALAEALARAVTDTTWRTEQEIAARQRAALFTWEKAAKIALSVYEKVVQ